ncbi:hypothetical protein AAFF_G00041950 [Aldrovandia affinis]|uniref:Uncharacterized protein n=1 Tax=Aldrovandia affinis TaxID=143900 RepID=A0AAD7S2K4_9TELE|nr:hypothetical protein AAFF_G00041950 [Aldrovandia affinis]
MSGTQETALPSWQGPCPGIPLVPTLPTGPVLTVLIHVRTQITRINNTVFCSPLMFWCPPQFRCQAGVTSAAVVRQAPPTPSPHAHSPPSLCRVTRAEGHGDEQQRGSEGAVSAGRHRAARRDPAQGEGPATQATAGAHWAPNPKETQGTAQREQEQGPPCSHQESRASWGEKASRETEKVDVACHRVPLGHTAVFRGPGFYEWTASL